MGKFKTKSQTNRDCRIEVIRPYAICISEAFVAVVTFYPILENLFLGDSIV